MDLAPGSVSAGRACSLWLSQRSRRRSDGALQIANYEAEEDRKRKEREEAAAGEGWTVVKRHKVHFSPAVECRTQHRLMYLFVCSNVHHCLRARVADSRTFITACELGPQTARVPSA